MYFSALLAVYVSLWPNKHKKLLLMLSCILATVSLILSMRSNIDDEIYKEKLSKSFVDQKNEILKTREQSEKLYIELTEANNKLEFQKNEILKTREQSEKLYIELTEANNKLEFQKNEFIKAKKQNEILYKELTDTNRKIDDQKKDNILAKERHVIEGEIKTLNDERNKIVLYEYYSELLGTYYSVEMSPSSPLFGIQRRGKIGCDDISRGGYSSIGHDDVRQKCLEIDKKIIDKMKQLKK
jgi:hypothetical protein